MSNINIVGFKIKCYLILWTRLGYRTLKLTDSSINSVKTLDAIQSAVAEHNPNIFDSFYCLEKCITSNLARLQNNLFT